jgi:hypothetical protein
MSLMIVFADSAKRMAQERLSQGFVQGEVMVRANREGDKGLQDGSFFSWVSDSMVGDQVPPGAPLHLEMRKMKLLK